MMIRPNLALAATVLAILMNAFNAGAQQHAQGKDPEPGIDHEKVGGILTDRLNKSQLKIWKSIMEIVLAKDSEGRPTHPKLYGLYHQAAASGHEIQIELSTERATLRPAGICRIEFGSESRRKEALLIRLNLGMIDRAISSEQSRRASGFIPFEGLRKRERYAEVLGHELAHVVRLVANSDYRGLYLERKALDDAGSEDVQAIRRLTRLIEQPAEETEVEIWNELMAGREPRI